MSRLEEIIGRHEFTWRKVGENTYKFGLPGYDIVIDKISNSYYEVNVGNYCYPKKFKSIDNAKVKSIELVFALNKLVNEELKYMLSSNLSKEEIELNKWKDLFFRS